MKVKLKMFYKMYFSNTTVEGNIEKQICISKIFMQYFL